mmetsp:Transcript_45251/g.60066  ORF Transcript_45251/g.60066 Transcript_45251/m.60066 type:complete len:96 (+) Transcript_45251:1186-1473(+)
MPALDLIISEKFLDVLCPCAKCTQAFSRVKKLVDAIENRDEALQALENNLDGEINQEEESKGGPSPTTTAIDGTSNLNSSIASAGTSANLEGADL